MERGEKESERETGPWSKVALRCSQSFKSAEAQTEPFRNALIKADSRLQSLSRSHARAGSTQRERRERNTMADRA